MRLVYMAGKGGVGKSVCSAATGLWASQQGNKTLAFSMDPAHSLSDILEVEIGDRPKKIAENFDAVEPDLAAEAEKFYASYRSLFRALFEMFQFEVRPQDFGVVPGVGELIFMDRLYDVYMEGNYEVVVIDSAPTALVLPLLKLPDVTTGVVTRLLGMKSRWTGIFNMLEPGFGDSIVTEVRRGPGERAADQNSRGPRCHRRLDHSKPRDGPLRLRLLPPPGGLTEGLHRRDQG
jgi:arsenite-transporting ATPase